MEITLYSEFSKRRNSTKNPESEGVVSVSVTKNVTLKGKCSMIRPSFFIADVTGFVYCKAWGWYYFITNVSYDINGAQYIECELDALGTWRSAILGSRAFIQYSSSNYDEWLKDSRVATEVLTQRDGDSYSSVFTNNGCYLISTLNNDLAYGGVTTYAVSESTLKNICANLVNDNSLWDSLDMVFGDVSSSLLSCRYIPVPLSYFYSTQGANVVIGDWDTGESGYITNGRVTDSAVMDIPWVYDDFRRCNEFTRISLVLPFIGAVDLDTNAIDNDTQVQLIMVANGVTGVINYSVEVNGGILNTYSGSFGRDIPISTSQMNAMGAMTGYGIMGGSLAAGVVSGAVGNYGGVIKSIGGLILGAVSATKSEMQSDFRHMGGFGGGYGEYLISNYYIITTTFNSRTEPTELTELYGRPCYKVLSLSELTGYVETIGFSIDVSALDEIKQRINQAMDSGVYLE